MLVGQSPQIMKIKKMIREIAKSDSNALITGEDGSGKQLVAEEIQQRSKQKNKPFVSINCTALGDTITETDLYGEKVEGEHGIERKIGLLEQAKKGIVYLKNFDEMKPEFQQIFFNMLHEGKFRLPDKNQFGNVEFRTIAATTDGQIMKKETIRRDLLSLVSQFSIHIPPLRDRKQDIQNLFDYFLNQYCEEFNREKPSISVNLYESIIGYEWRGNVGELKNAVRNLVVMSPEGELSVEYLPFEVKRHPYKGLEGRDLPDAISEVERYLINQCLRKSAGNQTKAARALNISEAALRYKMKKYGLSKKLY